MRPAPTCVCRVCKARPLAGLTSESIPLRGVLSGLYREIPVTFVTGRENQPISQVGWSAETTLSVCLVQVAKFLEILAGMKSLQTVDCYGGSNVQSARLAGMM